MTGEQAPAAVGPAGGESDVNKLKHLEMIQAVISRMAGNSFLIKGWCVTLVGAIIALASKDDDKRFIAVAYFPVLMFWLLDGYFLNQERLYRALYDAVRVKAEKDIDFSMNAKPIQSSAAEAKGIVEPEKTAEQEKTKKPPVGWARAFFSRTLLLFYGVMVGAVLLSMLIVLRLV